MSDHNFRRNSNDSIEYSLVFDDCSLYWTHFDFGFVSLQPHHGNNTVAFIIMLLYGFFGFALIYVVCELSQRISNAFCDISDAIDTGYDWYLYPLELQRMLPLIMLPIQKPVVIRCFGCVQCSRRAFKNVSMNPKPTHFKTKKRKFTGISIDFPGIQDGAVVLFGIQNDLKTSNKINFCWLTDWHILKYWSIFYTFICVLKFIKMDKMKNKLEKEREREKIRVKNQRPWKSKVPAAKCF